MARDSWAVRVRLGLRGAVTGLALAGGLLLPPVVVAGPAPDDAVGVGLAADTPVGIASGSESAIGTGDAAVAKRAILVQWSDRLREAGLSDLESWQREIGALLQAASSEGLERARSATTYSELIDALQGLAAGDKPSGADGLRLQFVGYRQSAATARVQLVLWESAIPGRRPIEYQQQFGASYLITELRPSPIQIDGPFGGLLEVCVEVDDSAATDEVEFEFEIHATLFHK